jgi:hypothetical protein
MSLLSISSTAEFQFGYSAVVPFVKSFFGDAGTLGFSL